MKRGNALEHFPEKRMRFSDKNMLKIKELEHCA